MPSDQHLPDYCGSMVKSLSEKLFFVSVLPREVTALADFGCADGALLKRALVDLRWDRPTGVRGVGYDRDERMIDRAKNGTPKDWMTNFTSSFGMFRAALQQDRTAGRKSCLVLSSVIHEWLSDGQTHGDLVDLIDELDPDWVAIRDMAATQRGESPCPQEYLKSAFPENAEQEAEEDYFAFNADAFVADCVLNSGWKLRHYHRYIPAHVQKGIYARHGVWVEEPTHVQILLKRR